MEKDLKYYLSLRYKTEINPISEDDGGGFEATIPQLGRWAFSGHGNTPSEALKNLDNIKKEYFEDYLKREIEVPEPEPDEEFGGRILLRVPKYLHRELSGLAKQNGISTNQLVNHLLERAIGLTAFHNVLSDEVAKVLQSFQNEKKDFIKSWEARLEYEIAEISSRGISEKKSEFRSHLGNAYIC